MDDKLTHDERLRLECLAQAISLSTAKLGGESPEQIVKVAQAFQSYVGG